MSDYNGTDEDDIIDASELTSDIRNIYPGKGDDIVKNVTSGQTIIAGPGEDQISGNNFDYAMWQAIQGGITINLKEGWSDDGFGGRDYISGVATVHGSGFGDTIFGTASTENFFANGGNNIIDGGGGEDTVSYTYGKGTSKDFEIAYKDDGSIHVKGPNDTLDILTNISTIKFFDDDQSIDVAFFTRPIKAKLNSEIYTFYDNTMAPEYTYAGKVYESRVVSWFAQGGSLLDLNEDGIDDAIFPMSKGYASGVDGTTPFIALTTSNGTLIYDEEINLTMPNITSSRRAEPIKLVNSETLSIVSVNHDTEEETKRSDPDRTYPLSELTIINTKSSEISLSEILPKLTMGTDSQPYAVDAHSMAVGDINGDGLDDIFIGDMTSPPYALIQQSDGKFIIENNDFYKFIQNVDGDYSSLLLDAALVDVNNDGFDDLIAGFGHGDQSSLIYINKDGKFDKDSYIKIPDSVYGSNNQLHMKTMPYDFDKDGDIDLAIQWSRYEPYYGGHYIQILLNDGTGNYTDNTDLTNSKTLEDAYLDRLLWSEPWQLIDINNDGHMDIAGAAAKWVGSANKKPIIYINDGKGNFDISNIATDSYNGTPFIYSDFDNDGLIEFVTFKSSLTDSSAKESKLSFYLFELTEEIGTGPNFQNTSKDGSPGFNESYYLNQNIAAKEAVDSGNYENGFEHYLAEGKEAGLDSFAPFTKVHGYSGNDNIILREGNEIALGYGGNDSIEGGAGDDIIDGGAGSDTAIFRDTFESYTLTYNDDGSLTVKHNPSSSEQTNEGIDTLTNIEKLQFSDLTTSAIQSKYSLSSKLDSSKNILKPFSETSKSGTLNFSSGNNIIVADGQAKTLRGLDGDDTYFISDLLPKNSTIEIIDTSGSNTIQIAANTKVVKTLWTKDATRLTFEDDKVITVNGADKFTFNMGGNVTDGTDGIDLTFAEFALSFGIDDILNLSGSDTGTVTDMYII